MLTVFTAALALWLVIGAVVGVPGPGPLHRHSLADLDRTERILRDNVDPDDCSGPNIRWHRDHLMSRVVVTHVSWSSLLETPDVDALRGQIQRAGLPNDIVVWPRAVSYGDCLPVS
jgi:hypothetical protein